MWHVKKDLEELLLLVALSKKKITESCFSKSGFDYLLKAKRISQDLFLYFRAGHTDVCI